jgi:hypothetical protein
MTMLAGVVDAVIGIDTQRDSHEVEIADAAGKPAAREGQDAVWSRKIQLAVPQYVSKSKIAVVSRTAA